MTVSIGQIASTNTSVAYYEANAQSYAESTLGVDMGMARRRFLAHLPAPCAILDAGCGAGRDIKAFHADGYAVAGYDASGKLCAIARQQVPGIHVRRLRHQDLEDDNRWDGIWACATLVHVLADEEGDALARLRRALRPEGRLYACWKLGHDQHEDGQGRWFRHHTQATILELIEDLGGLQVLETWISTSVLPGRDDRWLNIILGKACVHDCQA